MYPQLSVGGSTQTLPPIYISNLRVTYGAALYTAAFTPPTGPLGPSPSGTTALLLRVPQSAGKLLVSKIGGTSTVQAYPPAAMTDSVTNMQNCSYGAGTYLASVSTTQAAAQTHLGFDKNSSTYWYTQNVVYNGSTGVYTTNATHPQRTSRTAHM